MKTKIITVINQKGGVGKSAVAFHLAHAPFIKDIKETARKEKRVLCIDMDSQGNLSQFLTGDIDIKKVTKGGVGLLLEGKELKFSKTTNSNIDLLHGHQKLDRYDDVPEVEDRGYGPEISETLRGLGYDYVIIDTPPSLGFRHLAPLVWSDLAIIPMEPALTAIAGFQDVITAIEESILPINPKLRWFGVVNRANLRVRAHREKEAFLKENYGARILATFGARTAVAEAMENEPAQAVWERPGAPRELRQAWRDFCQQVLAK
jgi:chromosome partitioning protein